MRARDKSRFTTKQAAWIALSVFAGWLVFLFFPTSSPRAAPPLAIKAVPQSQLESVGLANNADWEGLPGFFAIWADGLKWEDDKTYFEYWNPGKQAYSYRFAVARNGRNYRFQYLGEREVMTGSEFRRLKEEGSKDALLYEDPSYRTETHPFDFSEGLVMNLSTEAMRAQIPDLKSSIAKKPAAPKVPVDLQGGAHPPAPDLEHHEKHE